MINGKVEVIHWNGTWLVLRGGEPLLNEEGAPWDKGVPRKVTEALSRAFGAQEEDDDE